MSYQVTVNRRGKPMPFRRRLAARLSVMLASALSRLSPAAISRSLQFIRRHSKPATYAEASASQAAVVASSIACARQEGCLQRSLATVLLCRMKGTWPTWCIGVRARPPFGAHAWIEAEGRAVGDVESGYLRKLITVGHPDDDHPRAAGFRT